MLPGMSASFMGFEAGGSAGSFGVTAAPSASINKTGSSTGAAKTLTTISVTAVATGGAGGNSYAWVRTSGSALIAATSAATADTAFTATLNPGDRLAAEFTCTVTDSSGAMTTVIVSVTITLVSLA